MSGSLVTTLEFVALPVLSRGSPRPLSPFAVPHTRYSGHDGIDLPLARQSSRKQPAQQRRPHINPPCSRKKMAHRRGRVGVGRGLNSASGGPRYSKKAEELKSVSVASAVETVKKLETKLTEFAKKHKKEIQTDPAFRKRFLEMCAPIGVDPLASEKGFWGSVLGIGDFYYELAVKVSEICMASRSRNGGIISVSEVRSILLKRGTKFHFSSSSTSSAGKAKGKGKSKGESKYSEEDIIIAVGKLSKLGSGFRTVKVADSVMIVSVPTELNTDHTEVMEIAQNSDGTLSSSPSGTVDIDDVMKVTGWTRERSQRALDLLLGKGMAWLDVHKGRQSYWFPSIWREGGSI